MTINYTHRADCVGRTPDTNSEPGLPVVQVADR